MSYRTVHMPQGVGIRCFRPDEEHAQVARYLRIQARSGFLKGIDQTSLLYRVRCTCGVNLPEAPNSVTLILTRDAIPGEPTGWHLSVCCVTSAGFRGYQPSEGEHWADLVFGKYRSARVASLPDSAASPPGREKGVRHFRLDCDWADGADPAVSLEGVE